MFEIDFSKLDLSKYCQLSKSTVNINSFICPHCRKSLINKTLNLKMFSYGKYAYWNLTKCPICKRKFGFKYEDNFGYKFRKVRSRVEVRMIENYMNL